MGAGLHTAISFALDAHGPQKDKGGELYILHPLRVMLSLDTSEEKIVGVLHDVVEDTSTTLENIRQIFGEKIRRAVGSVSRRKGERYLDFIKRASLHPVGRKVKIADIEDNLLPSRCTPELKSLRERYARALEILQCKALERT